MSRNHTVLNIEKDNKDHTKLDPALMEMVFGTPNNPKRESNQDVHLITNEKKHNEALPPTTPHINNLGSNHPRLPMLEPDKEKQKPPLAGPEIDDIDEETVNNGPYPGIDDGLLEPDDKNDDRSNEDGENHKEDSGHESHDDGVGTDDGINGFENRVGFDDRPISPMPGVIPDVNTYQQKKNLAQGMMDLALLSANANQLRYVIETANGHPYYFSSLTFISLSIILQIGVGIGLILNSRYNVKDEKDICKADKINNMTVLGVFLVTIVNVFITSFSVAPTSTGVPATVAATQIQQAG
ncbi:ninjurin A [Aphomia sociella]